MKYKKTVLSDEDAYTFQRLIVKEHYLPHTEQFGHLEYMAQYNIEGKEYLFHRKDLMGALRGTVVYLLEED